MTSTISFGPRASQILVHSESHNLARAAATRLAAVSHRSVAFNTDKRQVEKSERLLLILTTNLAQLGDIEVQVSSDLLGRFPKHLAKPVVCVPEYVVSSERNGVLSRELAHLHSLIFAASIIVYTSEENLLDKIGTTFSAKESGTRPILPRIAPEHRYILDPFFVGRYAERSQLTQWLNKDASNIAVLESNGGTGKSALAWVWSHHDALGLPVVMGQHMLDVRFTPIAPIEGLLWWSFYEPNSQFPEFLRAAARYFGTEPDLTSVLEGLRLNRAIVILDGFERELRSYSTGYRSNTTEDSAEPSDKIDRSSIDAMATQFLVTVAGDPTVKSRVLLTTRLFPSCLDADEYPNSSVERCRLRDLDDEAIISLFSAFGLNIPDNTVLELTERWGNHAQAVRLLLGLMLKHRDTSLEHARRFDPVALLRSKRRHVHIYDLAYSALGEIEKQLLCAMSINPGPVDWELLTWLENERARQNCTAPQTSEQLELAVRSLQARGLAQWDEYKKIVDLHPVVRKYAYEKLTGKDQLHTELSHYFESKASRSEVESRNDLDMVVAYYRSLLYDESAWSKNEAAALKILYSRLAYPLVERFRDIRTALELFQLLSPDRSVRIVHGIFDSESLDEWFNKTHLKVFRFAGLYSDALAWSEELDKMQRNQMVFMSSVRVIAARSTLRIGEKARLLREVGKLQEAAQTASDFLETCGASRLCDLPDAWIVDSELYMARLALGREAPLPDIPDEVSADLVLHQARGYRYRIAGALDAGQFANAMRFYKMSELSLARAGISAEAREERGLLEGLKLNIEAQSPAAEEVWKAVRDGSEYVDVCRREHMPTVQAVVHLGMANALCSLRMWEDGILHARNASALAYRGGLRLVHVDSLLAEARLHIGLRNLADAASLIESSMQLANHPDGRFGAAMAAAARIQRALARVGTSRCDSKNMDAPSGCSQVLPCDAEDSPGLPRKETAESVGTRKASEHARTRPSASSGICDERFEYDLFISHASEDKESVARPLYDALTARGLSVWLDESELALGDSLRRKIDSGLAQCRFGVVILSPDFFAKEWPQRELDGLVARETATSRKTILPVWHNLDEAQLQRYSPVLADRIATSTRKGIPSVAEDIARVLSRQSSVPTSDAPQRRPTQR